MKKDIYNKLTIEKLNDFTDAIIKSKLSDDYKKVVFNGKEISMGEFISLVDAYKKNN